MAYARPEDLLARYDAREVGDLLSTSDRRIDAGEIATHPIMMAALEDASGQIRSAALVANKYTEADLDLLYEKNDSFLIWLTCTLAVGNLRDRRSVPSDYFAEQTTRAANWLAAMRLGERIFNVDANKDAGNPSVYSPRLAVQQRTGFLSTESRYFPGARDRGV